MRDGWLALTAQAPLIIAHRGAWQSAPQNSLRAFETAIELGCDAVELDVRRTADGRLVVLHDPDGQDVWDGDTRCVAFVQADVDLDIASDPMLPGVGWSWLMEALDVAGAEYAAAGGDENRLYVYGNAPKD